MNTVNKPFPELTEEVAKTAIDYAHGLEVKEIAAKKFRSAHTINNQIKKAMEILGVKNGRELAIKYAERVTGFSLAVLMMFTYNIDLNRQRTVRRTSSSHQRVYRPRRESSLLLEL